MAGTTVAARWWTIALQQPGPLPAAHAVVIPKSGTGQLAKVLADDGLIVRPWLFRLAVWVTRDDGPLHAAEFAFPAHASMRQILAVLRTARPVEHHLTLPEGLTAQQIAVIVSRAEAMTGAAPAIEEGSLLPQTYDYEYGGDRAALVSRAQAAMARELAADWAGRAADLPLATPQQAVILASIVERETAKPEERPHVAAVYLNRLRQGMRLEADPTVAYAASGGSGVLQHPLTRGDLRRDDPFNTYRNTGLPPGPICSPGRDSLRAVLHPSDSDDLFFVADGTGGHVFSRTFAQHDAAVSRWRGTTLRGQN